ncbi:MAG: TonB-dependent receptor [Planctomycetota bacterium]|jgi:hemoglobin/transferrin/lactoferrin receptor protein|nr:TonB-dependent receptor [Planctomycetota bacterium]
MIVTSLILAFQSPQEPEKATDVIVTASAFEESSLSSPFASDTLSANEMRDSVRSLPEALKKMPSVLMQKTAYGQSSPFIRGFTAYHNKMLIDGVPLNFAGMRSGPNQYWSTVDMYSVDRLEIVRGTGSVLYGSDAIGGVVQAFTNQAPEFDGNFTHSSFTGRYSTAEESYIGRQDFSLNSGNDWRVYGGYTSYHFNDLTAGSGLLPDTGYSQFAGDIRYDMKLNDDFDLTVAAQSMRQADVPRTHKTVNAVPFEGSDIGSELQRDYDQRRDLVYAKLGFAAGSVTLSVQDHIESRDRIRSGDRRDISGFDLRDIGLTARFETDYFGDHKFSYGAEVHRQSADSFSTSGTVANPYTSVAIQGPIGDDSSYDSTEIYFQDSWLLSENLDLTSGVRLSRFELNADRVENPNDNSVMSMNDSWNAITGSVRSTYFIGDDVSIYGGISQGFRAPSLSDMTADIEDSVAETPTVDLDPERYVQFEVGVKGRLNRVAYNAAIYNTAIDNMIVRSPTGNLIGGVTPEVSKSNVGKGYIRGVEFDINYSLNKSISMFGVASWQDGEVDQYADPADENSLSREPVGRLMPTSVTAGLRWQSISKDFYAEAWAWSMGDATELSFRDATDTSRIPPGGTPGFTIFGVSGGMKIDDNASWTLSLENLSDQDYRIHGSGLNSPGFNVITTFSVSF